MKTLIKYWINWKLGSPWHGSAYKVRLCDMLIQRRARQVENKYKAIFQLLDLDYSGYLALRQIKEEEIAKMSNNIKAKFFPSLFVITTSY